MNLMDFVRLTVAQVTDAGGDQVEFDIPYKDGSPVLDGRPLEDRHLPRIKFTVKIRSAAPQNKQPIVGPESLKTVG